jgi:hypothetical protein
LIGLSLGYRVHLQTGSVQIKNPWFCTPRCYSDKTNQQALIFPSLYLSLSPSVRLFLISKEKMSTLEIEARE